MCKYTYGMIIKLYGYGNEKLLIKENKAYFLGSYLSIHVQILSEAYEP